MYNPCQLNTINKINKFLIHADIGYLLGTYWGNQQFYCFIEYLGTGTVTVFNKLMVTTESI